MVPSSHGIDREIGSPMGFHHGGLSVYIFQSQKVETKAFCFGPPDRVASEALSGGDGVETDIMIIEKLSLQNVSSKLAFTKK